MNIYDYPGARNRAPYLLTPTRAAAKPKAKQPKSKEQTTMTCFAVVATIQKPKGSPFLFLLTLIAFVLCVDVLYPLNDNDEEPYSNVHGKLHNTSFIGQPNIFWNTTSVKSFNPQKMFSFVHISKISGF